MSAQNDFSSHDEMKKLVTSVGEVFQALFGSEPSLCGEPKPVSPLLLDTDLSVSVSFVGTVFGEFIISMSSETAEFLVRPSEGSQKASEDDIRDTMCEALNMIAGTQLKHLTEIFPKLTITAPKTIMGKARYPAVTAQQATVEFSGHPVVISFFLDEMRLDIAESYRDNLDRLQSVNQELLLANEQLKMQQMQLVQSEKMASLGVMAAGVAHEINNPLSFVMSNSEVLTSYLRAFRELFDAYEHLVLGIKERRPKIARENLELLKTMHAENDFQYILQDTVNLMSESKTGLDRIRGIVNGLKLFSRIDDEGLRPVQLNEEIRNTLQLINNELKYKCQVEFEAGDVPEVECVPGELGQVFVNLFINASQAMPNEGGVLKISSSSEGDFVRIDVSDNGCGIPAENIGRIFDPFFTTKPVGHGTGLGLSISHSIIEKHRGRIEVKSKVGQGTTFTIFLPLQGKAPAQSEAS